MPELLVEVGCEELPATFVRDAYESLCELLRTELDNLGILGEASPLALGTPRRLIVCFPDVEARQPDVEKEVRGPAIRAAYDGDGNPTAALQGFCRSAGVELADLRKDDQYVWATKAVKGLPAADLLAEAIPKCIRSMSFEKSMRWGSSKMRFARPIRWILALLSGKPIRFEIEGVHSDAKSYGHRFYGPGAFEVSSLGGLMAGLRQQKVEPDPDVRLDMIRQGALKVALGQPELSDALLEENVFLTEYPTAIQGEFRSEYLDLPEAVLITAMAKHEKMFPIRDATGRLTNQFVFIRNSGEDGTVRKGCEWVLNARFNDAQFFYNEDRKSTMDDFLEKTRSIVFQEKLGSVRERADRLAELSATIAEMTGAPKDEQILARTAALYSKADLSTGLVSEFASLQGVIGAEYAKREGMLDEVCHAIEFHYQPHAIAGCDDAKSRTAARLVMADCLDKLAGYLGLGLAPSGSSDPFGLRRAATQLIELAWKWPSALPPYSTLFRAALELYGKQGVELDAGKAAASFSDVFGSRYEALMPEIRYDILDAARLEDMPESVTNPRAVKMRCLVLESLSKDKEFVQTATRPLNIVASAAKKGEPFEKDSPLESIDVAAIDSVDGVTLYRVLKDQQATLESAMLSLDGYQVAEHVRRLAGPINAFFDTTMVMAEESDVRAARLSLMHATCLQLLCAGDFSKLVSQ